MRRQPGDDERREQPGPHDPAAVPSATRSGDSGEATGRSESQATARWRRVEIERAEPGPASIAAPRTDHSGGRPSRSATESRVAVTFADVDARARRLVGWAEEEAHYIRTHAVALFNDVDREGRDTFADEGLYQLLPNLNRDAGLLYSSCGAGPMWSRTNALCRQASQAVQSYYQLWQELREASLPALRVVAGD